MKLTIVTINRNNYSGLKETINSVLNQSFRQFEYIIIDGASTDGSLETIYDCLRLDDQTRIPHGETIVDGMAVKWLSESDSGIYNAMNKGCKMATGDYILMLNSADTLLDENVVEKVIPHLEDTDIIQGNILYRKDNHLIRYRGYATSNIRLDDILGGAFVHQASFISRNILERVGYYDESYSKNADTYFFITALGFNNATFRYINLDVSMFDMHGISNDPKWAEIDQAENEHFFNSVISHPLYDYYQYARKRISFYDSLHRSKFIWYCAVLLSMLDRKINGPLRKVHKEVIR